MRFKHIILALRSNLHMNTRRIRITFIALALLACSLISAQSEWELAKEKNGIVIHTRQLEGSNVKEFKAQTFVEADIADLETLIDNIEDYPEWQANVKSTELIDRPTDSTEYFYLQLSTPWPVKKRDMVLFSTKSTDSNGVLKYDLKSESDHRPESDQYIRITDGFGKWQFTPMDDGKIEVYYEFYADPAGSVPSWLVNAFVVDGPYDTLTNLIERVSE